MHIVNSQVWQAVDGQIFLLEQDCRGYEQDLLYNKLMTDIIDSGYSEDSAQETCLYVLQNFAKIKRIMQTGSAEEQPY